MDCLGVPSAALATALAWAVARIRYRDAEVGLASSGTTVFYACDEAQDRRIVVELVLTDDSMLRGYLDDFDATPEADANRELALSWPIVYRPPGSPRAERKTGAHRTLVQANRIEFINVTYFQEHRRGTLENLRSAFLTLDPSGRGA